MLLPYAVLSADHPMREEPYQARWQEKRMQRQEALAESPVRREHGSPRGDVPGRPPGAASVHINAHTHSGALKGQAECQTCTSSLDQRGRDPRERNISIMEIKTLIVDNLGWKTGVSIDGVRVQYDRHENWILITGRLAAGSRTYTSFEYEPELAAEVINKSGQVCISATSHHDECFAASQQIPFTIRIEKVSDHIAWKEVEVVRMYLVFRKKA